MAALAQETLRPGLDHAFGIGVLSLHRSQEIGHVLDGVGGRKGRHIVFDRPVEPGEGRLGPVIQADPAFERQRVGAIGKARDADAVAEHVVDMVELAWNRRDDQAGGQHALVVAFQRTEHHPVFAKRHRFAVAVVRDVTDRKDRHWMSVGLI